MAPPAGWGCGLRGKEGGRRPGLVAGRGGREGDK